jgi:hypothetical protein
MGLEWTFALFMRQAEKYMLRTDRIRAQPGGHDAGSCRG